MGVKLTRDPEEDTHREVYRQTGIVLTTKKKEEKERNKLAGKNKDSVQIRGFSREVPETQIKRIIMSIEGPEKEGKTHFSLTAPAPLALINIDNGLEGVKEKFLSQKEIYTHQVEIPSTLGGAVDVGECEKLWDSCKGAYLDALGTKGLKSLVMDTATEMWELIRLARFGRLTQVMPFNYGPVNAEFRDLIRAAYNSDKNVIFIHMIKPKYINDERTHEMERAGFGDMGYLVQANVLMRRDVDAGFVLHIKNCRQNPEVAGLDLMGVMCNFPFFAANVFPGSDPGEWE